MGHGSYRWRILHCPNQKNTPNVTIQPHSGAPFNYIFPFFQHRNAYRWFVGASQHHYIIPTFNRFIKMAPMKISSEKPRGVTFNNNTLTTHPLSHLGDWRSLVIGLASCSCPWSAFFINFHNISYLYPSFHFVENHLFSSRPQLLYFIFNFQTNAVVVLMHTMNLFVLMCQFWSLLSFLPYGSGSFATLLLNSIYLSIYLPRNSTEHTKFFNYLCSKVEHTLKSSLFFWNHHHWWFQSSVTPMVFL